MLNNRGNKMFNETLSRITRIVLHTGEENEYFDMCHGWGSWYMMSPWWMWITFMFLIILLIVIIVLIATRPHRPHYSW